MSRPCYFRAAVLLFAAALSGLVLHAQNAPAAQTVASAKAAPPPSDLRVVTIPQPPPTPEEIGDAFMSHQRYQAAIAAYKADPRPTATAWNKMGISYQMMFNLEQAAKCYQASLKLNPNDTHVLNNIATVYDSLKEYKAAEKYYRRALRLDPHSALILKNLGTNLLAQRRYEKGWEVYQQALAIDPMIFQRSAMLRVDNPAAVQDRGAMNYYMARGCARAGLNDRAIQYLRSAINEGFANPQKISADSEFAGLRGLPAFEDLLASQTARR